MFFTKKIQKFMFIFILMFLGFYIFPSLEANAQGPMAGFKFEYNVDSDNRASFSINATGDTFNSINGTTFMDKGFTSLKSVIFGIFGVCTLTMVVLFIINFAKLGTAAGNPQERAQATRTLLFLGIAAAMLGGVTLFVGFSTNLLK